MDKYYTKVVKMVGDLMSNNNELFISFPQLDMLRKAIVEESIPFGVHWLIITGDISTSAKWTKVLQDMPKETKLNHSIISIKSFVNFDNYFEIAKQSTYHGVIVDVDLVELYKHSTFLEKVEAIAERLVFIDNGVNTFYKDDLTKTFVNLFTYSPTRSRLIKEGLIPDNQVAFYEVSLQDGIKNTTIDFFKNKYSSTISIDMDSYLNNPDRYNNSTIKLRCSDKELYKILTTQYDLFKDSYSKYLKENEGFNAPTRAHFRETLLSKRNELHRFLAKKRMSAAIPIKEVLKEKKVVWFVDSRLESDDLQTHNLTSDIGYDTILNRASNPNVLEHVLDKFRDRTLKHLFIKDLALPNGLTFTELDYVVLLSSNYTLVNLLTAAVQENKFKLIVLHINNTIDDSAFRGVRENIDASSISEFNVLKDVSYFCNKPKVTEIGNTLKLYENI